MDDWKVRERPTDDELVKVASLPSLERQAVLIDAVKAAYDRGWADCEKAWTDYANVIETPPGPTQ